MGFVENLHLAPGQRIHHTNERGSSTLCGELEGAGRILSEARALLRDLGDPDRAEGAFPEAEQWYLLFWGEWAECADRLTNVIAP
jgi:hypothetical protein